MVEADFTGDYVNAENAEDGSIIEILAGSKYVMIDREGKASKKVLNVPVLLDGENKIYTPSKESGQKFVKAWGSNTDAWVGKKATLKLVSYKSFGQTKQAIEATPLI